LREENKKKSEEESRDCKERSKDGSGESQEKAEKETVLSTSY